MKNKANKLMSLLLAVMMAMGLFAAMPLTASAAEGDYIFQVTTSTSEEIFFRTVWEMEDYFMLTQNNTCSGNTVTLLKDFEYDRHFMLHGWYSENTFDMNGHTLTVDCDQDTFGPFYVGWEKTIIKGPGTLILANSSTSDGSLNVKEGELLLTSGVEVYANGDWAGLYCSNGTVTLAEGAELYANGELYGVFASSNSNVEITDVTSGDIGVFAGGGSEVTVYGTITVPNEDKYISLDWVILAKSDGVTSATKPGFLEYTDGQNIVFVKGEAACAHVEDSGTVTTPATCQNEGILTFKCSICGEIVGTSPIPKSEHDWVVKEIVPPTETTGGYTVMKCQLCGEEKQVDVIPPITTEKTDAEFLQERAAGIIKNGLNQNNLLLNGKVLTLAIDGREFILSTNANNRNISGEIALGDGWYLKFDIKGNGSNIKEFSIIQK